MARLTPRAGFARQLARVVSIVLHPFALALVLVWGTAGGQQREETLWTLALVVLCSILPLAWLMAHRVRRGDWADVDASRREERPVVYGLALLGLLVLAGALAWRGESTGLVRGVAGTAGMLVVAGLLNLKVKVSLHLAFAALTATVLTRIGSPLGWPLAVLVPVLAWSRLALGRHRLLEVVVGAALGLVTGLAVVSW